MLPRQPLRFLLADDPGAGKTIMTGLLIKEMIARGDLQRCLIVCPGNLVEQWQDELYRRFHLPFEIMTNDKYEAARTGNWFSENSLAICRLDKLSRNEDVQEKLKTADWDLVVCDEAHKMNASFWGGEIRRTKRYQLGRLLSTLTRHFLLLTATPHNGKEEDFQLFMALLDGDRFEGKFRDGVHSVNVSDLMRRMVKEELLKFDGRPLFPERKAYTVEYSLSDGEAELYALCPGRIQSGRKAGKRRAQRHGRLRPDHSPTPSGIFTGSNISISSPPPGTPGETPAGRRTPEAGRRSQYRMAAGSSDLDG
jgi:superfamily II DNA or RNA helicase